MALSSGGVSAGAAAAVLRVCHGVGSARRPPRHTPLCGPRGPTGALAAPTSRVTQGSSPAASEAQESGRGAAGGARLCPAASGPHLEYTKSGTLALSRNPSACRGSCQLGGQASWDRDVSREQATFPPCLRFRGHTAPVHPDL